jgi:predicted MFS family arabinose efflux permease
LPVAAILGTNLFLIGISSASIAPYRAIVAIDNLGISNSVYAVIMTLTSVATAIVSLVLGYFSDRIPDRRLLVIACAVLGGLAYGLIYLYPTQLTYIIAFCIILPFGGSLFSQTFSFSRAYFDLRHPDRAEFMVSVLRTLFSVAWIIVPPVAGWIASAYSVFNLFAVAVLANLSFTLIFGLLFTDSKTRVGFTGKKQPDSASEGWQIPVARLVGIGGVTLIRVALALHLTTLSLALINDFGGTFKDVGIRASIAAGLQVPFMLLWGLAQARFSKEAILVVNSLIYALYLLLLFYFARSVWHVFCLQGLNAIATAALLSITISYMQESIKGRLGLSTSLMDVVSVASTFIAAAVFATFSSRESYIIVFAAASMFSIAGAGFIAISRAPRLMRVEGPTRPN